jgi:hypothetical protein
LKSSERVLLGVEMHVRSRLKSINDVRESKQGRRATDGFSRLHDARAVIAIGRMSRKDAEHRRKDENGTDFAEAAPLI